MSSDGILFSGWAGFLQRDAEEKEGGKRDQLNCPASYPLFANLH